MQAKEFLSRHHIVYQPRDVENDPAAARELADLGFRSVPVVLLPGRTPILGFNAKELGAAIGAAVGRMTDRPEAVYESLDRVLAATLSAAAQLDHAALDYKMSNRDRNLRELIHDIFFKALVWSQSADPAGDGSPSARGRAPDGAPSPRPSDRTQRSEAARYADADALVTYGQDARAVLRRRFLPDRGADYGRLHATPDGPMTLGDAMSWIATHAAFHLRQLYWLMEHDLGIKPREPVDLGNMPGVILPAGLW